MFVSVTLAGKISNDISLRYIKSKTSEGTTIITPVCEFDVAVESGAKSFDKKIIDFYTIQIWGKYGESLSNYLEKGRLVFVLGTGKFDKWKDSDGKALKKFKVKCNKLKFLDSYNENISDEINDYQYGGDDNVF